MKEFFERHQAKLELDDLRRFARILLDDLGPVLSGHEIVVRLLDTPDVIEGLSPEVKDALAGNRVYEAPESGRLHLPVVHGGRPLALITATPAGGKAVAAEAARLLPVIVRLSLEKILLYKINVTDRETGLNNEDYFRTFLRRHISPPPRTGAEAGRLKPLSLGDKETHTGLTVLLAQVREFEKLTAERGRLEAARVLETLAARLREFLPGAACMARVDRDRLGVILAREDQPGVVEAAKRVDAWAGAGEDGSPRIGLALGISVYPGDFADEPLTDGTDRPLEDLADAFLAKAEAALQRAVTHTRDRIYTYRDVLERGGRVVQVLSFNRVAVNLGRVAGAREGQTFVLVENGRENEGDYKGEVTLFEVNRDFSLGEVINLRRTLSRIHPGDGLILSGKSPKQSAETGEDPGDLMDPVLGVLNHKGFMSLLGGLLEEEIEFALILLQVDGYDRYRTTMGHIESDRQFKALYDIIAPEMPEKAQAGRFSAESLAVYCPGLGQPEAEALALAWRDKILARHRQTASFGVAAYPCGPFSKEDAIANAQKALEHAAFLGPASAAGFNAVSLNISGDKRFEAGDLDGAIEEYNRALELDSCDLNVLNSLGVCYGYHRQIDKALEIFDRALEHDPDNLMAHYNRGFTLSLSDRPREALECFRRAAEIDPTNFDVLFHLGRAALDLDLPEEALAGFEKASRLKDRKPIVFRFLGQTLLEAGRTAAAVDAYKAAVRHDPEDADALSQLGVLYLQSGADLEVALSLLRQSVELDSSNGLFRQRLARACAAAGDPTEAEKQYRAALDLGARSREVFFETAEIIDRQGRPNEARVYYQAALEIDPEYKPAAEALSASGEVSG